MQIIEEIEQKLKYAGATFIGYANINNFQPKNLKEFDYSITVGVRLSDAIIDQVVSIPTFTYFHHYRSVNTLIDQLTLSVTLILQKYGYLAFPIPSSQTVNDIGASYAGIFQHKTAATLAGLGWIGKNGLFISKDYGPRVRLGTVLTNHKFKSSFPIMKENCKDCLLCVKNCPAKALTGNNWTIGAERETLVDAKACSEYMNKNFKHIGRGSVCGLCVSVCPKGKKQNP